MDTSEYNILGFDVTRGQAKMIKQLVLSDEFEVLVKGILEPMKSDLADQAMTALEPNYDALRGAFRAIDAITDIKDEIINLDLSQD